MLHDIDHQSCTPRDSPEKMMGCRCQGGALCNCLRTKKQGVTEVDLEGCAGGDAVGVRLGPPPRPSVWPVLRSAAERRQTSPMGNRLCNGHGRSRCAACMSCTCLILTSGACRGAAAVGTLQQIWEALTHSRPQGAASETQGQANEAATSTFWHALCCMWAPRWCNPPPGHLWLPCSDADTAGSSWLAAPPLQAGRGFEMRLP